MIIHHNNDQKELSLKDKVNDEDINETGTMIIKKKEIEFNKSNNWHFQLAD